MKITDGKYVVLFDDGDRLERIGMFEIKGANLTLVEDPSGRLAKVLPEGEMTPAHRYRILSLMRSGYYQVVEADRVVEE